MRRICERQRRLQLIRARIEEEGVTGWRIERERALRLAYVVAAHGLFAELENEFRTIVDFERLALRPVLRARATRAGRYLFRGPQRDVDSVDAALSDLLAPMADVQIGDGAARNARI